MEVKAEIMFEVPQETIEDLRDNWGVHLLSFLHDEIDIAINYKIRLDKQYTSHGYKLIGIKVGEYPNIFASGVFTPQDSSLQEEP